MTYGKTHHLMVVTLTLGMVEQALDDIAELSALYQSDQLDTDMQPMHDKLQVAKHQLCRLKNEYEYTHQQTTQPN